MKNSLLIVTCTLLSSCLFSQPAGKLKTYDVAVIAFWNVENLCDTVDDRFRNDDEFTPTGANGWNTVRYNKKIDRLSEAISLIGRDECAEGATVIGLCEVENKSVLNDLVNSPRLKDRKYSVLHIDGPDPRGIDPALLYDPLRFRAQRMLAYTFRLPTDTLRKTRHILVAGGQFQGEPTVFLICHWPSRRGGEKESRPNRMVAAKTVRRISDSIRQAEPDTKLVVMGDFNDDPESQSIQTVLSAQGDERLVSAGGFYNPMRKLHASGIGSLAFHDNWNLFDQILMCPNWLNKSGWNYYGAKVFNPSFLRNAFGKYKGYPLRTFSGSVYLGGYSDHFPVYVVIARTRSVKK